MHFIQKYYNKVPHHIRFLLLFFFQGMLFFSLFRIILFITEIGQLNEIHSKWGRVLFSYWAFRVGLRFDMVICAYLLAVPMLVLCIASIFRQQPGRLLYQSAFTYLCLVFCAAFFISAADIPFFSYNFSRLNAVVFNWAPSYKMAAGMIIEEPAYFAYLLLFLLACGLFVWLIRRRAQKMLAEVPGQAEPTEGRQRWGRVLLALLFLFLNFLGIRGRTQAPIRIENAFSTSYGFTNQLGLNPVFTLITSYLDKVELMDEEQAIAQVRQLLHTEGSGYDSPLAREMRYEGKANKKNVVLVIMESMSAEKMSRYGNPHKLSPVLDSLALQGYCFDHIYSAGKHTFNGIYASLFSYPAVLREHPMSALKINTYSGFPWVLKQEGYQTVYFTTHNETFDNVQAFLTKNHFDRVYAQHDYPKQQVKTIFGVPDHSMFEFAIPQLNKLNQQGKPFFAALMTTSDHGPYVVPEDIPFKPKPGDIKEQIVEYADWSIGHFLRLAAQQSWYKNTVFVFVADHGAIVGNNVYDLPLSYHHSPFIIVSPDSFIRPQVFAQTGGQIDVFPTVMGLLGMDYVNNTFGIDLLREQRPYIFFSADDKIACLDSQYLYVWRQHGEESLYRYKTGSTENFISQQAELAARMKNYALSMIQGSKWMIEQDKTGPVPLKKNN